MPANRPNASMTTPEISRLRLCGSVLLGLGVSACFLAAMGLLGVDEVRVLLGPTSDYVARHGRQILRVCRALSAPSIHHKHGFLLKLVCMVRRYAPRVALAKSSIHMAVSAGLLGLACSSTITPAKTKDAGATDAGATDARDGGPPLVDAAAGDAARNEAPNLLTDAMTFTSPDGLAAAGACSTTGWCWSNPAPSGDVLDGVWGSGPNSVWAVGNGTIVHWDGHAWSGQRSDTNESLYGVWGTADDDVWAVGGNGAAVHWNGATWTSATTGVTSDLLSVWGNGADDVWAVGGLQG